MLNACSIPFFQFVDVPGAVYAQALTMEQAKRFYMDHYYGPFPQPRILRRGSNLPHLPFPQDTLIIDESDPQFDQDMYISIASHRPPLCYLKEGVRLIRISPIIPPLDYEIEEDEKDEEEVEIKEEEDLTGRMKNPLRLQRKRL